MPSARATTRSTAARSSRSRSRRSRRTCSACAIEESDASTVSGMLLPAERRIVLNAAEAPRDDKPLRRHRFTIAHEIGHWVCHCLEGQAPTWSRYCRPVDMTNGADRALEREANVFAAELLMPEAAVRDDLGGDARCVGRRRQPGRVAARCSVAALRVRPCCSPGCRRLRLKPHPATSTGPGYRVLNDQRVPLFAAVVPAPFRARTCQ